MSLLQRPPTLSFVPFSYTVRLSATVESSELFLVGVEGLLERVGLEVLGYDELLGLKVGWLACDVVGHLGLRVVLQFSVQLVALTEINIIVELFFRLEVIVIIITY